MGDKGGQATYKGGWGLTIPDSTLRSDSYCFSGEVMVGIVDLQDKSRTIYQGIKCNSFLRQKDKKLNLNTDTYTDRMILPV